MIAQGIIGKTGRCQTQPPYAGSPNFSSYLTRQFDLRSLHTEADVRLSAIHESSINRNPGNCRMVLAQTTLRSNALPQTSDLQPTGRDS